jgi:hypothetical protein
LSAGLGHAENTVYSSQDGWQFRKIICGTFVEEQ